MDEVRFLLFEKKGGIRVARDLLALTAFVMCLAFLWLNDEFLYWGFLAWILKAIVVGGVLVYSYFLFYSMNEKEKLDGSFVGYISFDRDKIRAGELTISIEDIAKLEFHAFDYEGSKYTNYRSIEPKISNGTDNQVRLQMKGNSELKFNFQLNYENEFEKKMRDVLIAYHLQDKISFLALIQYIGISDSYERIQEFKKELALIKESKVLRFSV